MEDDLALAYVNVTLTNYTQCERPSLKFCILKRHKKADHNFTKKKKEGDLSISLAMITLSDSRPRWTGSTKHLEMNSNNHEY